MQTLLTFFFSNINLLSNLLFNIFSLNLSFSNRSGNNSNIEQYCILDKETLAKIKKDVREKKKAKVKKKKELKQKLLKKKRRPKQKLLKKKRMKAKIIAQKKIENRGAKNVEIFL